MNIIIVVVGREECQAGSALDRERVEEVISSKTPSFCPQLLGDRKERLTNWHRRSD